MNIPYINPTADGSEILHHLGCPKSEFDHLKTQGQTQRRETNHRLLVEVGSLSFYLHCFLHPKWVFRMDFFPRWKMSRPPSMASADSSHHSSPGNVSSYRRDSFGEGCNGVTVGTANGKRAPGTWLFRV